MAGLITACVVSTTTALTSPSIVTAMQDQIKKQETKAHLQTRNICQCGQLNFSMLPLGKAQRAAFLLVL